MKWPAHGGQPKQLQKDLQSQNKEILDFSANINPSGPPSWLKEAAVNALEEMTVYPDPDYSEAISAIASHEKLSKENVLLTNGGAEAIFLAAGLTAGGRALIIEPSFREYARACEHYQVQIDTVHYEDETFPVLETMEKMKKADAVFICRPHNPSGTVVPYKQMLAILEAAEDTLIFADEAFIDFAADEENLTRLLSAHPQLVILRSFTKMFAVPGLRSGYILASKEIIKRLKEKQIPWSVNTIANALVPKMTVDQDFVQQTAAWTKAEIQWLKENINPDRWRLSDTKVNFYLLWDRHLEDHEPLLRYLLEEGIAVRHTYNFAGLEGRAVRAAVRSRKENELLIEALRRWEEQT